jgi:hypothetical protein
LTLGLFICGWYCPIPPEGQPRVRRKWLSNAILST